jgi:hypothetical protein
MFSLAFPLQMPSAGTTNANATDALVRTKNAASYRTLLEARPPQQPTRATSARSDAIKATVRSVAAGVANIATKCLGVRGSVFTLDTAQ